tara:strand:- start:1603 stop:2343 length:741 start_codon:yes stop_codon:yes gene_type:complete
MLISSDQTRIKFDNSSDRFEFLYDLTQNLSIYLKSSENININVPDEASLKEYEDKFLALPEALKKAKIQNFIQYYDHCCEMVLSGATLKDKLQSLKAYCHTYGLVIPSKDEIYSLIDKDTFVEIYDSNLLQRYRSPEWLETISYSILDVELTDWRELFFRAEQFVSAQIEIVSALYSGKITQPVYKPIAIHTVKETKSKKPYCVELESLAYSPIYSLQGDFVGGIHILKLYNLRRLDFGLIKEVSI